MWVGDIFWWKRQCEEKKTGYTHVKWTSQVQTMEKLKKLIWRKAFCGGSYFSLQFFITSQMGDSWPSEVCILGVWPEAAHDSLAWEGWLWAEKYARPQNGGGNSKTKDKWVNCWKSKKPQTSAHKGRPGWREPMLVPLRTQRSCHPRQSAPFLSGKTNSGASLFKSEMGRNRRFRLYELFQLQHHHFPEAQGRENLWICIAI